MAWLFVTLGESRLGPGASWLWAITGALLGLYLVKAFGRHEREHADAEAAGFQQILSPRAAMERRWRRLGSVRGNLLADVDRQTDLSEALYRLEYGAKSVDDRSWLPPQDRAQAYDLQMPHGIRKRKRKPKRMP